MERELSDAEFIRNPDNWPRWPILPVVKRDSSRQIGIVAHFSDDGTIGGLKYWFYPGMNMFEFDASGKREELTDIDKFVGEGWRVD